MTYTKLHDYDETKDEDNIWFETSATPRNNDNHYLIYFVPGNPCLVAFYKPFLFELFKLLGGQGESSANVTVAASSLPGFEVHATGIQYCPSGLKQQITNVENLIAGCVKRYYDDHTIVKSDKLKVVLVAHSVGAYMVLEALRRRVEGLNDLVDMPLAGAVLLFPTVTEIARSWHGSMLKPFCSIPYFPALVSILASVVFHPFSTSGLSWCLSSLARLPSCTGSAAASFLKSPNGVYSALYLATDEMSMIKDDTWNETVWGGSIDECDDKMNASDGALPLSFYFGKQDVWVWNEARDRLIASRGRYQDDAKDLWKPLMIVDDNNVPHGFIVDHNKVVAEKACELIHQLCHGD